MLVSKSVLAGVAALAGLGFLALPVSAQAASSSVSKECSAQYQAAKKAGTLDGQKWPQFYSDCAAKMKGDDSSSEDSSTKSKKAAKSDTAATKTEKKETSKKETSKPRKAAKSSGNSTQQVCSEQYQAAKAAGTLGGKKWPQFYSDCAAELKDGGSNTAEAPTAPKRTKTASRTESSGHMTTQQICSQQYQAEKSAGTLGGKKWSQFYSDCAADIRNDKSDSSATPDEPKVQKTATNYKVPTVDKNGKPLTPGQIAFRQRIHECSVEYQNDKADDNLRGRKWPQYWSACNTRLKQED
jgi:hypothetical protein